MHVHRMLAKSSVTKCTFTSRTTRVIVHTQNSERNFSNFVMGRRPSMTLNDRLIAIGMLNGGSSVNHVARHFQVHERTIYRLQSRCRQTNSVKDRPRSGRPKKTTQREDRYLVTSSRRNRFLTSTALANRLQAATGTRVTFGTVRNRLRAAALRGRRPLVGVPLTQRHRRARLNWARAHLAWTR